MADITKLAAIGALQAHQTAKPRKKKGRVKRKNRVNLYKRGNVYWVGFTTNKYKRERVSLETNNLELAQAKALQIEYEIQANTYQRCQNIEIDELFDEYQDHCSTRQRGYGLRKKMCYLRIFRRNIKARILRELSFKIVFDFFKGYAKGRSPVTVNHMRSYLHHLFNFAIKQGYLTKNPASDIEKWPVHQRQIRALKTKQEINTLLNLFQDTNLYALVATVIYAGLRRSEACWLTWKDFEHIDDEKGIICIGTKEVEREVWIPKTGKDRVIPVSSNLSNILKAHENKTRDKSPVWVFPSPMGFRWNPDRLTNTFKGEVSRAGLEYTLLDLRHTFGSQLAMKGVSLYKIATFMGNSPDICRTHYANLIPQELHKDVEF